MKLRLIIQIKELKSKEKRLITKFCKENGYSNVILETKEDGLIMNIPCFSTAEYNIVMDYIVNEFQEVKLEK